MRQNADYLLTHPSIAQRLAEHCLDNGIRLPRLRLIETISEILRPATRAACLEAWGVPVIDIYTAREAGYIALQCPECEHYHVQAEGIFVEVLDEQDKAVRSGRCGPGGGHSAVKTAAPIWEPPRQTAFLIPVLAETASRSGDLFKFKVGRLFPGDHLASGCINDPWLKSLTVFSSIDLVRVTTFGDEFYISHIRIPYQMV